MLIYLQYLRGLAALAVVYFHISLQFNDYGIADFRLPEIGKEGVNIFFVLSGFIIYYISQLRPKTPRIFIWDRIVRVVPLYWFYSAIMTIMILVLPEVVKSGIFDLSHVVSSFLFLPHIHPVFTEKYWPLVIPGWTLNYEMYFYLIFGCSLFFNNSMRLAAVICSIGGLVVAGLLFSLSFPFDFWGNPIVLEFLLGMFIARFTVTHQNDLKLKPAFIVTVVLVIFTLAFVGFKGSFFISVVAALLVFWVTVINLKTKPIKFHFLKLLGDASYSLYLSHIFVIAGVNAFCKKLPLDLILKGSSFVFLAFLLSIVVGILSYKLVEKPLIKVFQQGK